MCYPRPPQGCGSSSNQVRALKIEIENMEGTRWYQQALFILCENVEEGSEVPLADDFVIEEACTIGMCLKGEEEWEWDSGSALIKVS